jgi:hypothetical protein
VMVAQVVTWLAWCGWGAWLPGAACRASAWRVVPGVSAAGRVGRGSSGMRQFGAVADLLAAPIPLYRPFLAMIMKKPGLVSRMVRLRRQHPGECGSMTS